MEKKKTTGEVSQDEAKDIIKSAALQPVELAIMCLLNGIFTGWSIVDLSISLFAQ